jgi:hypothetical protein
MDVQALFDTIVEDADLDSFADFPPAPQLEDLLTWRAVQPEDQLDNAARHDRAARPDRA